MLPEVSGIVKLRAEKGHPRDRPVLTSTFSGTLKHVDRLSIAAMMIWLVSSTSSGALRNMLSRTGKSDKTSGSGVVRGSAAGRRLPSPGHVIELPNWTSR